MGSEKRRERCRWLLWVIGLCFGSEAARAQEPAGTEPALETPSPPAAAAEQPSSEGAATVAPVAPEPLPPGAPAVDAVNEKPLAFVADAPDPSADKKKRKKKRQKNGKNAHALVLGEAATTGTLELNGRVFARAELARQESPAGALELLDLSVPSARLTATYRAPARWLSLQIEVELAGRPDLRDGYIQAKTKHFVVRAGQFKLPVSVIEMDSPWTLPLARRGFLNDLLLDYLDVAGRRPGVLFGWRGGGALKPALSVGAFQGQVVTEQAIADRETELIQGQGIEAQNLVARAELRTAPLDWGIFYQHRVGSPALFESDRYWTAGADLALDEELPGGGVRVWADVIFGASWYEHAAKREDGEDAVFASGRVIGAYRFGGRTVEELYVEPYVLGGILDPDLDVERDFATELAVGVNVGLWRRARATLELESWQGDSNFPHGSQGFLYGGEPDRLAVLLQAGAAF